MQNEHKPVVTDEGIETVTETDEAVLREIDRGIYRDRHKSYRSWNTWISESAAEFQRSKRTAQQLVDDQVQEITDLLHRAKADTRPHVQAAAGQLACSLSMMKLGISEGDVLGTAFRGMLVGRQAHQLWIKMEHEEKAMLGRKNAKSRKGANEQKEKDAEIIRQRIRDFDQGQQGQFPERDDKQRVRDAMGSLDELGFAFRPGISKEHAQRDTVKRALGLRK